jgi:hypothetical protein
MRHLVAALLACCTLAGCARAAPPAAGDQPAALNKAYERSAASRIVAIGDLHGDLDATRKALRLAGAIGADDRWAGGSLVVVQTGDSIDRGDDDRAVLELLDRLFVESARVGGALIALSGNHEIMNVQGDLRYVSKKSAAAFEQGRARAFAPSAPFARLLASWPVIVKVGDSLFAHGGVLPAHVKYGIDKINQETTEWMRGERAAPPVLLQEDSPVWTRLYSADPGPAECAQLEQVLSALGAARLVVGHTPQPNGISSACNDKVWRIDTGMSHFYGGTLQVLNIEAGQVSVRAQPK